MQIRTKEIWQDNTYFMYETKGLKNTGVGKRTHSEVYDTHTHTHTHTHTESRLSYRVIILLSCFILEQP